jgi:hypothetical protein
MNNWCNRWLSIGGRYTLLKATLEGQPMYWMALAAIPLTVLEKLRKLTFNFLWSGCQEKCMQHLCNWETLATPKSKGGWGFETSSNSIRHWLPQYPLESSYFNKHLEYGDQRQIFSIHHS